MEHDLDAFLAAGCDALLTDWGTPPGVSQLIVEHGDDDGSLLPAGSFPFDFAAGSPDGGVHAAPATADMAPQRGAHRWDDDAAAGAPAAREDGAPAPASSSQWRCLHPLHPPSCTRCSPPPPPDEIERWALVGDKSYRSGERKLRCLVVRAPEWASEPAREASAAQLQRDGQSALAEVLLSRNSAALRKASLMALCAHWGYKCDAWAPRTSSSPTAQEAGPSAAVMPRKRPRPAPPPLPPPQPPPESSILALRGALRHRVALYAATHAGDTRVHAAAAAEPGAPIMTWNVPMYDTMIPIGRAFAAATAQDAALLAARAAWASAADEQWWMSDDAALLLRADVHLQVLRTTVAANGAGLRSLTAAGHTISAPDAAIAAAWTASMAQLDLLADTCGTALANARAQRRGSEANLSTAAEVLFAISAALTQMIDAADVRRAWCIARGGMRGPPAGLTREGHAAEQRGTFWPAFVAAISQTKPTARCVGMDVDRVFEKLHIMEVGGGA